MVPPVIQHLFQKENTNEKLCSVNVMVSDCMAVEEQWQD
jgi:hypothetical protein